MTEKNKKALLICIAIVVASYLVHSMMTYSAQMSARQVYLERMQQAKKNAKGGVSAAGQDNAATSTGESVAGKWVGMFVSSTVGGCTIQLQLDEPKPGHYTGYPEFSCAGTPAQAAKSPIGPFASILNTESIIMSGDVKKEGEIESVRFHIDKNAGTDVDGCVLTSFTVTPGATNTLIAEWEKGTCPSGHTLLRRGAKPPM